jgi:hypothetical protein
MRNASTHRLAAGVAALALTALGLGAPAHAANLKAGVLTCDVAGGWGYVIGSSKDLRCTFTGVNGETERYTGTVSKFGIDVGYTRGGVIVWEVLAPASDPGAGALQGGYAGATLSAAAGLGVGAHALVGGLHRSIALQPLSLSGERGLNVAAGIGAITLRPAP